MSLAIAQQTASFSSPNSLCPSIAILSPLLLCSSLPTYGKGIKKGKTAWGVGGESRTRSRASDVCSPKVLSLRVSACLRKRGKAHWAVRMCVFRPTTVRLGLCREILGRQIKDSGKPEKKRLRRRHHKESEWKLVGVFLSSLALVSFPYRLLLLFF